MTESRSPGYPFQMLALVGALLSLAYVAYLGSYSRYLADDYCTAGSLQQFGFWGAQGYWYANWSGRFAFTFLVSLTHLVGPVLTPFLPAMVLAALLGTLLRAVLPSRAEISGGREWLRAGLLAGTVLLVSLTTTPKLYQSMLWQTGLLTYVVPLVLASWMVGSLQSLARQEQISVRRRRTGTAAVFALALVAAGFSESYGSAQTSLLLLLFVGSVAFSHRRNSASRLRLPLAVGTLGSALALLLVASAPGNAVRQGVLSAPTPLPKAMLLGFYDTYLFAAMIYRHQLLPALLAAGVPALVALGRKLSPEEMEQPGGQEWIWIAGVPLLTVVGIAAVMAPSEYALSSYPDGRILIGAHFLLAAGLATWGYQLGKALRPRFRLGHSGRWLLAGAWMVAAILVGLITVRFVADTKPLLADARGYASAWDERHVQLKAAAETGRGQVEARSLTHMGGLAEIGYDPDEWINRCVAQTYGLSRIVAK